MTSTPAAHISSRTASIKLGWHHHLSDGPSSLPLYEKYLTRWRDAPLPVAYDGCHLDSAASFVGNPRRYPSPSPLHMQILQVSPTEQATVSAGLKCVPHQIPPPPQIPSQPTRRALGSIF